MAKKSWQQLIDEADGGMGGNGAIVEAMWRVKKSNSVLTFVNGWLAVAASLITIYEFFMRGH